nr:S8 family peptidase [Bacillus alkalicellulosilyticus]
MKEIKEIGIHVVTVSPSEWSTCLSKYASSPDVMFVEEDHIIHVDPIPNTEDSSLLLINVETVTNDPLYERQWGLANVNAQGAWELARVSPMSARIAILDTGVNRMHPDLRGKVIHDANFSDSSTADDGNGHGTHVAGIAAAVTNNRNGIAGMSYNSAGIMNIKVMEDSGSGSTSNIAQGIIYAANQGAHVINLSIGSPIGNETLRNAVNYAYQHGALVVGAAGNNSTTNENYPAAYQQVIAVAALDRSNQLASFSNHGTWVDVAAPGEEILSTYPETKSETGYRVASGTSQATPFISGLAGLIKATNPTLTNRQIRSIILRATDRSLSGVRYGRIDARRAVQLAQNSTGSELQQASNIPSVWLNPFVN